VTRGGIELELNAEAEAEAVAAVASVASITDDGLDSPIAAASAEAPASLRRALILSKTPIHCKLPSMSLDSANASSLIPSASLAFSKLSLIAADVTPSLLGVKPKDSFAA
jgi:hypothetical protein